MDRVLWDHRGCACLGLGEDYTGEVTWRLNLEKRVGFFFLAEKSEEGILVKIIIIRRCSKLQIKEVCDVVGKYAYDLKCKWRRNGLNSERCVGPD